MNKKLLLTTALVGFVFANNASALEIGDWVLPGNGSNLDEVYNIDSQADTIAKSITVKDNATLGIKNTKVEINTPGGTGAFTLQDTATLNMQTSNIIAKEINTNGGVANLDGDNSITADSMSFKNTELNFSGNKNELRSQDITLDGITANVNDAGALSIAGGGQTINFLNTNIINTKDGGVEFKNSTANIDGVLTIIDTSGTENAKGKLVLNDTDENTGLNLSGSVNADVDGKGDVNFITSTSKIDGDVTGVNTYFQNNHTLSNSITGDIDVAQLMISNGGSLLADKTFTSNDLVVGSKDARTGTGNLTLKADVTTGGSKVNKGSTLDIGDNSLTIAGGQFQGHDTARFMDGSTFAFNYGKGKIIGDANLEGTVTLKPTIALGTADGSHEFVTGNVTKNDLTINNSTFDPAKAMWTGYNNNSIYDITLGGDNKSLEIQKRNQNEIASKLGVSGNQAAATYAVISGGEAVGNASFNNIANNINNLLQSSNPSEVAEGLRMVDQMSVDTTPAAQSTSTEHANAVFGAVGSHLSGGSLSGSSQGMSSGDSILERGTVWAQGLVNKTKLDTANGFDADSNGLAVGAEKQITDQTKLGVGYAYSTTDIDTDNRSTDVDTQTAIVYGEYKPSQWYVNGIATYSWGSYDEDAGIKTASYDVNSIGLQAMTGYEILMDNNVSLTPETGLRYVNVNQKSYTDSLGSRVSENKSDILTGVAGLKVSKVFALANGMNLKPEARAALTYDFSNDDANSVVALANGSSYTTNGEALDRFGQEVGLALTAEVNDNVEMSVGYEGRFREDYTDHSGLFNAKYKF